MTLYFDASAWVKAYKEYEVGRAKVLELLRTQELIFSSRVAYAEVLFALRRAKEAERFSEEDFQRRMGAFLSHWDTVEIVEFSDPVTRILRDRVLAHALRALDAIHLASALWVREFYNVGLTFVCADGRLLEAATQEQLTILNPEETD